MSKISLLKEEIEVLHFINSLQNKINKIKYVDTSFEDAMKNYFTESIDKLSDAEKTRLKIILLNLEELNLIEGDVLESPRMTETGICLLKYYKGRNKFFCGLTGGIIVLSTFIIIKKIFKS